jgi:hypothetical protein
VSLAATPRATVAVLRGLIDEARRKGYADGVFGVRAQPVWTDAETFVHEGVTARVAPCVSALAVREALLEHEKGSWLVVLTDRPEDDLGYGLLAHLLWNRLRTPDPWAILRQGFAATGLDPALTTMPDDRELATGLLALAPRDPDRWPAAPAGVLTRGHAFTAVAARAFNLRGLEGAAPDAAAVLDWSMRPDAAALVAAVRADAGDPLTDALLDWAAGLTGTAASFVRHLVRSGDLRDVVPLGLVVGVLDEALGAGGSAGQAAREGLVRLESRLGGRSPDAVVARGWQAAAAAAVHRIGSDPDRGADRRRVLSRADDLLVACQAAELADRSLDLPSGLTRRVEALGGALRAATAHAERVASQEEAQTPRVIGAAAAAVEVAWSAVVEHRLWLPGDPRAKPVVAAVRLTRWLATDSTAQWTASGLTRMVALSRRHLDVDAWVDSAVHDAERGVGDADLGSALASVLSAVRARRTVHDVAFATALGDHSRADPPKPPEAQHTVHHLEDVLPTMVLPLAQQAPVLLLVLDGMSAAVATEVLAAATVAASGWSEALWTSNERRVGALAALPTLTTVSRTSLLCGELRTGEQQVGRTGFANLTRAHGLTGAALRHKRELDTSRPGHELADDVAAALDDIQRTPLVACVLNTIDDALDRSDPGGTDWNLDTIKHLRPLLDRARLAGRVVVLTSDHGHVIERRAGAQRPFPEISSGRSRSLAGGPAGAGEVLVEGRRVLEHGGRAVLAVDELLRYGPLKAGYHGGASPAEVVVPVAFLVPGAVPAGVDLLRLAPPQEPAWWSDTPSTAGRADPATGETAAAGGSEGKRRAGTRRGPAQQQPADGSLTLFDVPAADLVASRPVASDPVASDVRRASVADAEELSTPLADSVLASPVYVRQRKLAGRSAPTDDQVRALLAGLLGAPGNRLGQSQVAVALRIPPAMFRGALAQVQRLLNVEGYPVVALDADGATTILDEPLLREQFGVSP